MSTNLKYIERRRKTDRENEKVGGRPAKLNEKKDDRYLEREIKTTETFFFRRTT